MMTDINIWSSSLDEGTIYSWMTCEEDSLIQENKIIEWKTSNWTNENIQVESLNRSTVCFRKERRGRVYPFNSNKRSRGSKGRDFFEAIDFCQKLGGKIPVPKDLQTILQLRSKCGAAHPFTGWMIVGDSGVFRDPYTFQVNTVQYSTVQYSVQCTPSRPSTVWRGGCGRATPLTIRVARRTARSWRMD